MIERRDPDFFGKFRMAGCLGDERQLAFFLDFREKIGSLPAKAQDPEFFGKPCHLLTDIEENMEQGS